MLQTKRIQLTCFELSEGIPEKQRSDGSYPGLLDRIDEH
jgi:hypothetical protein